MEKQIYRVFFKGEISPSSKLTDVQKNLAALFKVDIQQIQQLFTGKPFVLKENSNIENVKSYKTLIEKTGALCQIVSVTIKENHSQKSLETSLKKETIKDPFKNSNQSSQYFESRYRLAFDGEIESDKDLTEVKTNLSIFYKVKPDQLEGLFTGKPIAIKEHIDFWTAAAYLKKFKEYGAICHLEIETPPLTLNAELLDPDKYKIVFSGKIKESEDLLNIKTRLSSIFKVSGVIIDKIFMEKPVLIKTNLTFEEGESFKNKLENAGILCYLLKALEKPPISKVVSLKTKNIEPNVTPAQPQSGKNHQKTQLQSKSTGNENFPEKPIKTQYTSSKSQFSPSRQTKIANTPQKKNTAAIFITIAGILLAIVIFKSIIPSGDEEKIPAKTENIKTAIPKSNQPKSHNKPIYRSPSLKKKDLLSDDLQTFQDSNSYFLVNLPSGFQAINKSTENQSNVTFKYSLKTNVSILATPFKGNYEIQESLIKKVNSIQEGKDKKLSGVPIKHFGQIQINGMDGYEILLQDENQIIHLYALVGPKRILYTISIVSGGRKAQEHHDKLDNTLRNNFYHQ